MTDLGNQSKKKKITIGKSGGWGVGGGGWGVGVGVGVGGGDKAPPAPPPAWSLFALTQVNIFKTSCFAVNDYTISDS